MPGEYPMRDAILGAGGDDNGGVVLFARDPMDGEAMFVLTFLNEQGAEACLRRWLEQLGTELSTDESGLF